MQTAREPTAEERLTAARAAPIFRLMGWRWGRYGRLEIPGEREIAERVAELVQALRSRSDEEYVRVGRLHVRRDPEDRRIVNVMVDVGDVEVGS